MDRVERSQFPSKLAGLCFTCRGGCSTGLDLICNCSYLDSAILLAPFRFMNIFLLHRGDEVVCRDRVAELACFGDVILCSDKDDMKSGYTNLCSFESFPDVTSWDAAFSKLADDPKDSWFIENDVRWGKHALAKLFQLGSRSEELISCKIRSRENQPDWYWWQHYAHHFPKPIRSFNPVCRLRESLVRKILGFRDENGGFVFHELLFASLATSCFDMMDTEIIGSAFRWRPEVTPEEMLSDMELFHPVKNG